MRARAGAADRRVREACPFCVAVGIVFGVLFLAAHGDGEARPSLAWLARRLRVARAGRRVVLRRGERLGLEAPQPGVVTVDAQAGVAAGGRVLIALQQDIGTASVLGSWGNTMRDAVKEYGKVVKAPYAYPIS